MTYDFIIIGGGILGTATAWQLQLRFPDRKILLLEKENQFAFHQTGHNSGVIHAGVYYEPGSLKAEFCKQGAEATKRFCRENNITFDQCGKLLVATNQLELQRMEDLYQRCLQNELEVELLDESELRKRESALSGIGAIYVKSTGIVDYAQVCRAMAEQFRQTGGEYRLSTTINDISENDGAVSIKTNAGDFQCAFLISCAGLHADRIVHKQGIKTDFQIIPFRGEYYRLVPEKNNIISHLIYPVPDPDLPFLGVHLTRMIDGSITVGPNAVLGWKREGYGKINFDIADVVKMLSFPGFWQVMKKHYRSGLTEIKNSLWKLSYLKAVQKYCAQISVHDLLPHPAGVRAQAVMKDGTLMHDFLFAESSRSLHVCNAPSPAATSAIPISKYICTKISEKLS